MFARCPFHLRLLLPLIFIHTTCVLISLRRTSAPIHLTSVLVLLGTQATSCILIAGLLERNIFDLCLPEFDKPWVIHLRETCYCSTNLCTWRPNTVYKNRSVHRHQYAVKYICAGTLNANVSPECRLTSVPASFWHSGMTIFSKGHAGFSRWICVSKLFSS